jgi:hypothetical protein
LDYEPEQECNPKDRDARRQNDNYYFEKPGAGNPIYRSSNCCAGNAIRRSIGRCHDFTAAINRVEFGATARLHIHLFHPDNAARLPSKQPALL